MIYPATTRLLALDMDTVTGWAILASGVVTSGSQDFSRHRGNKSRQPDHIGTCHAQFDNWLTAQFVGPKYDAVVYEDAGFFKSDAAVQICVGFRGLLLAHTAKRGLPVFAYAPSSVKKFWAKSGAADKDTMRAALVLNLPDYVPEPVDDNEIDALALLHLHLHSTPTT